MTKSQSNMVMIRINFLKKKEDPDSKTSQIFVMGRHKSQSCHANVKMCCCQIQGMCLIKYILIIF
jgi:hypothetical protein